MGKRQLQRMAQRMVKRAGITDETGVTVSFGFSSLLAAMTIGFLEELPYIGLALTFLTFSLHRIVLVTDQNTHVFRARPFHRPGDQLGVYAIGPAAVSRVRGKLTFSDGQGVWHSPLVAFRVRRVEEAATGEPA
jgi:hypothetical protein